MAALDASNSGYIAVIGAGSWGTALAMLLARNGNAVQLWGNHDDELRAMREARENTNYLPGIKFPEPLIVANSFYEMVANTNTYLLVVPSHAFRSVLEQIVAARTQAVAPIIAWGTKGFDPGSGKLLGEVVAEVAGRSAHRCVISGPSFATEVARGLPTAITVAADDIDLAEYIAAWLRNDRMRAYTSDDLAGVQLGGAIKNVIALAAGISDGLGFGANARAALITRGLAELIRLGVALGGRADTFMGLAGMGDLVLTCTDNQSRNRRVGLGLGAGKSLQSVLAEVGQEAEGVGTVKELYQRAVSAGIEMPITEQVYKVIYENLPPQRAVDELFRREPKSELE